MSNADPIAEARRVGLSPDDAPDYGDQYRRLIWRMAEALESQPAPLVADSREALARGLFFAYQHAQMWQAEEKADALIASGFVSVAGDRDRALKAEVWPKAFYAGERHMMEHQAFTDPEEHNPYRESEGK